MIQLSSTHTCLPSQYKRKDGDPPLPKPSAFVAALPEPEAAPPPAAVQAEVKKTREKKADAALPPRSGFAAYEGLIGTVPVAVTTAQSKSVPATPTTGVVGSGGKMRLLHFIRPVLTLLLFILFNSGHVG